MNGALPLISAALMLIGMFVVMLRYDWVLACVALVVSPPLYLAIRWLTTRIHGHATAAKEAESELYSRAETAIGAVKLVQAYGREERVVQDFRAGSERSLALSLRLYGTETLFVLVVESLLATGTAAIVWLGALRVMSGALTIGELTVFLSYLRDLYQPILSLSQNLAEISSARVGLERVFSVLDAELDVKDAPDAQSLPPITGEIRFENVSFAYDDGRPVLRDIDLRIAPGEHVAIVGRTGAGKTTLAGLVLRFFDPQRGRVTIDGHDLRQVTPGVPPPAGHPDAPGAHPLPRHRLREHRVRGSRNPDPATVREAARRTEAESFILALPQGYETSWARTAPRSRAGSASAWPWRGRWSATPPIVDPGRADQRARRGHRGPGLAQPGRAVARAYRDRDRAPAEHRPARDRIVVIDDGAIVEQGPHDELMARRGAYFDLWQRHGAESTAAAVPKER